MGYYIFSYSIDAEQVKQTIGSIDQALFDAVVQTEEFQCYADQDFDGHTRSRQALEHLILGKRFSLLRKYNKTSAHAYWYAFISICAYLGEKLPSTHDMKLSYETDLINEYLKSDFGIDVQIEELMLSGEEGFFGLPQVSDWPLCGLWPSEKLLELRELFAPVTIADDELRRLAEEDDEKEMAYDSIRQIKENITYCIDNKTSLISFCH